eukprot:CAMPEP_0116067534 /NCGR_PEP_ID=MMETSP0322-20121206/11091_1 /TAXON_ID=163516 /ORGANISM="Leptocylindrus danicus var. apora, Strain B651" /LENGTH=381 /DNA_ID=CAMNT_0003554409 /DNA_START=97 /DNA_END=1239 /DNA_ORIENTATION=+
MPPHLSRYTNNSSLVAPVTIRLDENRNGDALISQRTRDDIESVLRMLEIPDEIVNPPYEVRPLSGGLSNRLLVVNDSVLVRLHSNGESSSTKNENSLLDRESENKVSTLLAQRGAGPTIYGRFQNGRLEQFYRNVRPLSHAEMPYYAKDIAEHMAKLHDMKDVQTSLGNDCLPSMFDRVDGWIGIIEKKMEGKGSFPIDLYRSFKCEWKMLKSSLLRSSTMQDAQSLSSSNCIEEEVCKYMREIVFTHMDLQSLNILKESTTTEGDREKLGKIRLAGNYDKSCNDNNVSSIKIIDFEYAGMNSRAADIANTFCEYCDMNNLSLKYADFPNESEQNVFLSNYLSCSRTACTDITLNEENFDAVLKAMRKEVGRFTLLSHLGW